jgi:ArsR family transcriptional regulator, arsenate/arsenite/antimonite-responsive transcriptional repressor
VGKVFDLEMFFAALADRTRLRLINLMSVDEMCVCFFVEVLGTNQPKISRHLAYLRRAGLVAARKDGKWVHYRLNEPSNPHASRVFGEVRAWLAEDAGCSATGSGWRVCAARRSSPSNFRERPARRVWSPEPEP